MTRISIVDVWKSMPVKWDVSSKDHDDGVYSAESITQIGTFTFVCLTTDRRYFRQDVEFHAAPDVRKGEFGTTVEGERKLCAEVERKAAAYLAKIKSVRSINQGKWTFSRNDEGEPTMPYDAWADANDPRT